MRKAASEYLQKLTKLTSQMGGSIMVLGSPQQRNLEPGTVYEDAFARAVTIIREVCDLAGELGVTLAMERAEMLFDDIMQDNLQLSLRGSCKNQNQDTENDRN